LKFCAAKLTGQRGNKTVRNHNNAALGEAYAIINKKSGIATFLKPIYPPANGRQAPAAQRGAAYTTVQRGFSDFHGERCLRCA